MDLNQDMHINTQLTERELEILHLMETGDSNNAIAKKLFLTLDTVKWYTKQIYSKLEVHSRTQAISKARLVGLLNKNLAFGTYTSDTIQKTNLPALVTEFIGRTNEVNLVKELILANRLLTLTGPPGTGKTRLALHASEKIQNQFPDGVFFVDLSSINDHQFVAGKISQIFHLKDPGKPPLEEILSSFLRNKNMLLILDNFEHVIQAAPLVSLILSNASALKLLITSREILQVYGEQEYPVPVLNLPDLEVDKSLEQIMASDSVKLFIRRARASRPDFSVTDRNIQTIANICIALDGLPLPIELAAAKSRIFTPEEILSNLNNKLGILIGGPRNYPERLQTLRGTLDWSYELLSDHEKTLFTRMSIFRGGRTPDAIQKVCTHDFPADIIDVIESIMKKSLLLHKQGIDGESRFFMLGTIFDYAQEKLKERGEWEELSRRHSNYCVQLAEQAEKELFGNVQDYWFKKLRAENDNLRASLSYAVDNEENELGLRLVGALRDFWYFDGYVCEGLRWAKHFLDRTDKVSASLRGKALNCAGWLSYATGEVENGKSWNREALEIYRDLGDKLNCAWALIFLGAHHIAPDEYMQGISLCEEGLVLFKEAGLLSGMSRAYNHLGELWRYAGNYEYARKMYEECLAVSQKMGDSQREAFMLANLGFIAQHDGRYDEAEELTKKSLEKFYQQGSRYFSSVVLAFLAGPYINKGNYEQAAILLAASHSLLGQMGISLQPGDKIEIDKYHQLLCEELGGEKFETFWSQGCQLTFEEAVDFALMKGE